MAFEQTIRSAVECSGVGLHSGVSVTLRIRPAPAGSGIVFRRADLDGFDIHATGRNVARVSYATSLMRKGVLISTTEHLLSAFIGMGVDNAVVELDNLELPILDGSALPYVEMIDSVGLKAQRRPRTYMRITRQLETREGDKLFGQPEGNAKEELIPRTATMFAVPRADAQVEFVRDEAGHVTKMLIRMAGQQMEGKRIK